MRTALLPVSLALWVASVVAAALVGWWAVGMVAAITIIFGVQTAWIVRRIDAVTASVRAAVDRIEVGLG